MKLRIARRAERQAEKMEAWWIEHRSAAARLFTDELEATLKQICETPGAGVAWPTPRRPTLRRILMPHTRNHVYFRVDEGKQVVHVLAIRGAPKRRSPDP